jgi:hypothetical protein
MAGGWDDPGGPPRGGALRETARIAAVVAAALAGGAGLLLLITQVLAPAQPRVAVPVRATAPVLASPATAALPALPQASLPATLPPTAGDAGVPDAYLGDLTSDRSTNSGEIDGPDYRFAHGWGMSLTRSTQEAFAVPAGYQSMTATLKALGATIRFTLSVGGQTMLDQTLSPFQPPLTVTCATPEGSPVVASAVFQGGGTLSDAVAVWGNARFSTSPAAAAGCS